MFTPNLNKELSKTKGLRAAGGETKGGGVSLHFRALEIFFLAKKRIVKKVLVQSFFQNRSRTFFSPPTDDSRLKLLLPRRRRGSGPKPV